MIKFGLRQSFQKIEEVDERYSNLTAPVELAFPYFWKIYEPVREHLPLITEKLKSFKTEVLSVHAVQAPISREGFRIWGKETGDFAKSLGAKVVTVHPNKSNNKTVDQAAALENLKYFNDLYKGDVVFCIETFEGKNRVFTPKETVSFGLPMTLDTSHIGNDKDIWDLLKNYRENILTVHLSARGGGKQHQPIDALCKDIVKYLSENKWNGNIILEYLFEYHNQMLIDLETIKNI